MNVIIKPITIGIATYVISAVALWLLVSFVLQPTFSNITLLLPAIISLVPLFLSGFVAAKLTVSKYRYLRIAFGILTGLIGFFFSLLLTHAQGESWVLVVMCLGASVVAASGSFIGTRENFTQQK